MVKLLGVMQPQSLKKLKSAIFLLGWIQCKNFYKTEDMTGKKKKGERTSFYINQ